MPDHDTTVYLQCPHCRVWGTTLSEPALVAAFAMRVKLQCPWCLRVSWPQEAVAAALLDRCPACQHPSSTHRLFRCRHADAPFGPGNAVAEDGPCLVCDCQRVGGAAGLRVES